MEDSQAPFDVNQDFIEENKKMNLVRPRKKFAPYTKIERTKRRNEVYRLHFEKGIPALRIAEIMHVDKNTINNDIQTLYREAGKQFDPVDLTEFIARQIVRLEAQRTRLLSYLENTKDVEKKMPIERMISEIDIKLANILIKEIQTPEQLQDLVVKELNRIATDKKT